METQTNDSNPNAGKRWYVVHAYSGFEKSVAQALRDRIARTGMQDRFGDVMVPTEEVVEMRSGQKRRSERKFFPGYVLVQIATHEEAGNPADGRGELAPGKGNAEGDGLHRRHCRQAAADPRRRGRRDSAAGAG